MDTQEKNIFYESPSLRVFDTRKRSVLCTSTGGTIGEMTQDDDPGSWD